MKKAFEFFLVLIIFYGVYSAFDQIAPTFFPELKAFWIVIIALLVAAGLLLLYSVVVASSAKQKVKKSLIETIHNLEDRVQEQQQEVEKKDSELKDAFRVKRAVEEEFEETL